jgi:spermidine synthase
MWEFAAVKPTVQIATTKTPDGGLLELYQHAADFSIRVNREELMTSRAHESELELARLGCTHIKALKSPTVLIGGLGMGYTLRQALDLLKPKATVVVSELIAQVVTWNREILGELARHPLRDPRVRLEVRDVTHIIRESNGVFDAILLDVDNGPEALTSADNNRLYSREGLQACMRALKEKGCLSIWSCSIDDVFEKRLRQANLFFRRVRVPAHKGARARSRCVWVISRDPQSLPPIR